MKGMLVGAAMLAAVGAAQAQTKYEPWTMDETTFREMMNYLGDQPNKFSGPLVNWLTMKESQAAEAVAKAAAAKAEEEKAKAMQGGAPKKEEAK
jgi:hypothetical protein